MLSGLSPLTLTKAPLFSDACQRLNRAGALTTPTTTF